MYGNAYRVVFGLMVLGAGRASAVPIPASAQVCGHKVPDSQGLIAVFVDPADIPGPDTTASAIEALATLPAQSAVVPQINFPLRDDYERRFGPFTTDGHHFVVQFTGYISILVPGTYTFSISVDDGMRLLIGGIMIMEHNGGSFFDNYTGQAEFAAAGLYPFELIYYDLPVCCNGIRLGALGPEGSGLMSLSENPEFNFSADLGPPSWAGLSNPGPAKSLIPSTLFATAMVTTSVRFDYDHDCDVDLDDFLVFRDCVAGPRVPHDGSTNCQLSDADADVDVDQTDFGAFQRCFSGANIPADPDCAD